MHSKATASEILLGQVGVQKLKPGAPARILIGGLGLGFTLQSVLALVGPNVVVEVAELMPEVVAWNREHLQPLNGGLLDDPRVEVRVEDVGELLKNAPQKQYDVILLDVDNGPVAMVSENNATIYSNKGIRSIRKALKPRGRVVFWSAGRFPKFEGLLRKFGFKFEAVPAKVHAHAKRDAYTLYVADWE
jgi:spermidine synthase